MVPQEIFDARKAACKACNKWDGFCLLGHKMTSPQGCPDKHFEGIQGTSYAEAVELVEYTPCGGGCAELEPYSFKEVLVHFARSMKTWVKGGAQLADKALHKERYETCKKCPLFLKEQCKLCRCICYVKTALLTERCPDNPARW